MVGAVFFVFHPLTFFLLFFSGRRKRGKVLSCAFKDRRMRENLGCFAEKRIFTHTASRRATKLSYLFTYLLFFFLTEVQGL